MKLIKKIIGLIILFFVMWCLPQNVMSQSTKSPEGGGPVVATVF